MTRSSAALLSKHLAIASGDYSLSEKTHSTLHDALLHVPLVIKPLASVAATPGCREELVELVDVK